jgi:hypothetical protein
MIIADSYLSKRLSGFDTASDAYDHFLKKRRSGKPGSNAAAAPGPQGKRKKAFKKRAPGEKKRGLFGKANLGINSPGAKRTGLFGIKHIKKKPSSMSEQDQERDPLPTQNPISDPDIMNENSANQNQTENLESGASSDLNEISDKTPGASNNTSNNASESISDNGSGKGDTDNEAPGIGQSNESNPEEEQYDFYEPESRPQSRYRKRMVEDYHYDDPAQSNAKTTEKKKEKGISMGAVFGLLGAVAVGAIVMYVVMSISEENDTKPADLKKYY